jgi:hypothetical protein
MKPITSDRTHMICRLLWPVLFATLSGCGHAATVSGNVRFQGKPVRYGYVVLVSGDKTARSGVIGSDGCYAIEGVPRGAVKIAVVSRNPAKGRSVVRAGMPVTANTSGDGSEKTRFNGWFPLPKKFEAPTTSGLSCTVDAGRVNFPIELK